MKSIGNGCTSKISQPHIDQNQPALAQPKNKKNVFIEGIISLLKKKSDDVKNTIGFFLTILSINFSQVLIYSRRADA